MNQKILFIGGPKDGLRQARPPAVTAIQYQSWRAAPQNSILGGSLGFTTHTYNLKRVAVGDNEFVEVAVHSSITNPMKQLLKGYRYHRNPRPRR
jgi:hypothetical protein